MYNKVRVCKLEVCRMMVATRIFPCTCNIFRYTTHNITHFFHSCRTLTTVCFKRPELSRAPTCWPRVSLIMGLSVKTVPNEHTPRVSLSRQGALKRRVMLKLTSLVSQWEPLLSWELSWEQQAFNALETERVDFVEGYGINTFGWLTSDFKSVSEVGGSIKSIIIHS